MAGVIAALVVPLLGPVLALLILAATGDPAAPAGYVSIGILSAGIGALGVVLSGKIVVPTFAYNRERDRADYWQAETLRVNQALAERFVPALDSASHAVDESNKTMNKALELIARISTP